MIGQLGALALVMASNWDAASRQDPLAEPQPIAWETSYSHAMQVARAEKKMLVVYFRDKASDARRNAFETWALSKRNIAADAGKYVWLRISKNTTITVAGETMRLGSHASFSHLRGESGLALINLRDEADSQFGVAVTQVPFTRPAYYSARSLKVILGLPQGTLTQRTMVYAVRMHPDSPGSASGEMNQDLLAEAEFQSKQQANVTLRGHHVWDVRYQRIAEKLPKELDPQEVVAESWPDEGLVDAAFECVRSWRYSDGHWNAVREKHPYFAYDMQRGRNGVWYATGIFGRLRRR